MIIIANFIRYLTKLWFFQNCWRIRLILSFNFIYFLFRIIPYKFKSLCKSQWSLSTGTTFSYSINIKILGCDLPTSYLNLWLPSFDDIVCSVLYTVTIPHFLRNSSEVEPVFNIIVIKHIDVIDILMLCTQLWL